jgi:hypothetical protein
MSLEIMASDAAAMMRSPNFSVSPPFCVENGNTCMFSVSVFMTCAGDSVAYYFHDFVVSLLLDFRFVVVHACLLGRRFILWWNRGFCGG